MILLVISNNLFLIRNMKITWEIFDQEECQGLHHNIITIIGV